MVAAESGQEARRLYVVPLADVLSACPDLAGKLSEAGDARPVVQARDAPLYARECERECLDEDGLPKRIKDIDDLDVFGVKRANVPGEPPI